MKSGKKMPLKGFTNIHLKTDVADKSRQILENDAKSMKRLGYNSLPDLVKTFLVSWNENPIPKSYLLDPLNNPQKLRDDLDDAINSIRDLESKFQDVREKMKNMEKKL